MQTVGSASNAAAAVNALVKRIGDRHSLPDDMTLHTDNGPEFGQQFEAQIDSRINVTHGPAYSSNSQAQVENANKIWRGVMRRAVQLLYLHFFFPSHSNHKKSVYRKQQSPSAQTQSSVASLPKKRCHGGATHATVSTASNTTRRELTYAEGCVMSGAVEGL